MNSILLPRGGVVVVSLVLLIAIMMFLASVSFGGIFYVVEQTKGLEKNLQRQVTVQISHSENIEDEVSHALEVLGAVEGVDGARALSQEDNAELLRGWLGDEFDIEGLPLPRLIVLEVNSEFDLARLREVVAGQLENGSVDSQLAWQRQVEMSRWLVLAFGGFIFVLVLLANVLAIIFATRGAMASNSDVIEVLSFIGANNLYIARQFQRHFFRVGFAGTALGILLAGIFLFIVWWLFGILFLAVEFYGAIIAIAILFAAVASFVARFVVLGTIK